MALSAMMQQYLNLKQQYKDEILLFRVGDFYEMLSGDWSSDVCSSDLDEGKLRWL